MPNPFRTTILLIVLCLTACRIAPAQERQTLRGQATPPLILPIDNPALGGPPGASRESLDDDQLGRRFLPPPPYPPAPPGTEPLVEGQPADVEALDGLSLESLLSMACQNNPTLRQAQLQIAGTMGKALEAGLWPNPVVSYVAEQIGIYDDDGNNTPGEFQGAIFQQEIVTAHKRKLSRQKYLQRAKSAEFLALAQQWRVCNDVRIYFWRTVGARQILDVRRDLLKSAEDFSVTARERWNLGQITRADLRMTDAALQSARLQLLQADNRYRREFGELTSLVGVEMPPQPLEGSLADFPDEWIDFDEVLSRMYSESPEILAAHAKRRADEITVQRERVQPIPNIVLSGGAGYNYETMQTTAAAQVAVAIPLWDRNQGTIQQAEADLFRQDAEIRRTQLRLRRELSMRYEAYLTALQHVTEFVSVILPEAKAAYAEQLEAYQQNRQNWGAVLDSQRQYFTLKEQFVEQLITLRTGEVLINGFLLQGGLTAPTNPTPPGHIDAVARPR